METPEFRYCKISKSLLRCFVSRDLAVNYIHRAVLSKNFNLDAPIQCREAEKYYLYFQDTKYFPSRNRRN